MKNCAKNLLFTLLTGLGASAAWANPSVTITSVTQAIPWNGKVSIAYTVSGADGEGTWQLGFTGKIGAGASFALQTFDEPPSLAAGSHVAVWQADTDGAVFGKNPFVASAKLCRSDIVYDGEYMIVDVSGGRTASSYPVTFQEADSTATFNTDEYKQGKIVLKKVKAGTFLMGSPEDEEDRNITFYNYPVGGPETQHYVKFSKDFYCGVFPVTIDQFSNVVEFVNQPWGISKGGTLPIESHTYNQLVADNGFLNVFNGKTAFRGEAFAGFNFPTESQWEYVCRGGTTTAYYFGATADEYETYCGKWGGVSGYWAYPVGTFPANPWGFYDLEGEAFEFCQDRIGAYPEGTLENPAVDPVHGNGKDNVICRGFSRTVENKEATRRTCFYRSAARESIMPTTKNSMTGFRLVVTRSDLEGYEATATAGAVVFDTDTSKESLLAATVDLSADEFTYTGSEQKPTVTVTMGDKILTEGTDYTVAYTASIQVGTHTVTLTGCGHYVGIVTRKYYISYPLVGEETVGTAAMDFRDGVLSVTAPGTLFRIARNNTADWSRGGVASATVKARVAFAPLATEDAEPAEGDFVLAVEADGEGAFKWIPPADGFYLARLQVVDGETVVSTLTRKLKVTKLGLAILIK